ncbi:dihydrofolate reductase [Xylanibacillus composti]|nr:dihydrofolate reductase family protein [Xylanibacillus composti]MDT9724582.1 dihydrofolate reductase [Xylanibacillus composti]
MAKVIFGMTMSLDGFINDANGRMGLLYPNLKELGETDMMQEAIRTTGAVVMGRRTFAMASDPDAYADHYEFQVPIFVITKQAPERKPKENGRIRFAFVDTVEAAIQQAKQAAGDKNVTVVGGPSVGRQLLKAGLVDELEIGIMPILLGEGKRLFEFMEGMQIVLKKTKVVETGQRTDIWFTVQQSCEC